MICVACCVACVVVLETQRMCYNFYKEILLLISEDNYG